MQILMVSTGQAAMIDGTPHVKFRGRTKDGRKLVVWVRACSTTDKELSARIAEEFAAMELVEFDPAIPPTNPLTDATVTLVEGGQLGVEIATYPDRPAGKPDLWEEEWLAAKLAERGIQRQPPSGEIPAGPEGTPPAA